MVFGTIFTCQIRLMIRKYSDNAKQAQTTRKIQNRREPLMRKIGGFLYGHNSFQVSKEKMIYSCYILLYIDFGKVAELSLINKLWVKVRGAVTL
jgi:hypothetical protein